MKIPKILFLFLAIAQILLLLGHWLLFASLIFFFPDLRSHSAGIALLLFVLSISFLFFSVVTHNKDNPILRIGYVISAAWIPAWFYLLLASFVSLVCYIAFPVIVHAVVYAAFAAAALLSMYGLINARIARTTRLSVKLEGMPEYWRGKTAVLVTDIHLGHVLRYGFAGKVITRINKLKPNIVFIAGDFYDGVKTNFDDLAHLFTSVQSQHGIYFCSGNHEEIAGYKICEQAISQAKIHILENSVVEIEGLQIAGLAYFPENKETPEHIKAVLDSMKIDAQKPSILLKHVPNNIPAIAEAGISLQLSGHTHHGQIWPGQYIARRVYKGFHNGLKRFKNFQIYTSSGVGTWGPPLRVFTKSEIVHITFI